MPFWLYAATCLVVPQIWALAVAYACRRWERRQAAPPPSIRPDFNI